MDKSEKTKPWNDPVWLRALKIPFVAGETWADHFQRAKDEVLRDTAKETEVTPEMIEAGADLIRREVWLNLGAPYGDAVLDARSLASEVFLAMPAAR